MNTVDRIELLEQVDQLRTLLSDLVMWLADQALTGAVYPLPVLTQAEVPPLIVPRLVEGAEAVQLACTALTRLDRLSAQHPSTVMRLPGWLQLTTDPSPMLIEINALKGSIQTTLRSAFSTASTRSKACRELFPGVQMNQLYRHLHVIDPATSRMSFHWQPRSVASTHLSVQQAISLLHQAQDDPTLMTSEGAQQAVTIALEHIASLSQGGPFQLLCRTALDPHPRVALLPPLLDYTSTLTTLLFFAVLEK